MGVSILIPALIVVVVGGLGSLKGSLVGSLIIGQAETFGKAWLPGASMLMIYVVMAARRAAPAPGALRPAAQVTRRRGRGLSPARLGRARSRPFPLGRRATTR